MFLAHNITIVKRIAALRAETRGLGWILGCPAALVTAILRYTCRLFTAAVLAELTRIFRAAGTDPASVISRLRAAAFGTKFSGHISAAAALPPIRNCCRYLRCSHLLLLDTHIIKILRLIEAAAHGAAGHIHTQKSGHGTTFVCRCCLHGVRGGGAMTGFLGMNMAGGAMGGGFNQAQNFHSMGIQQQQQMAAAQAPAAVSNGWKCSCGADVTGKFCPECGSPKPADNRSWICSCGQENTGKFCQNCGSKKPAGVPQYRCDKCGWTPEDPTKAPRFCPECGDPFDNGDIVG